MSRRRIEFSGGWWADIRTAWSYEQDANIAGAWGFVDSADGFQKACLVTLRESVIDAKLPDTDGKEVAFGQDMWATVDGRIGRKIFRTCREDWGKWQEDTDPKDTSASSSESQQASPARSHDE